MWMCHLPNKTGSSCLTFYSICTLGQVVPASQWLPALDLHWARSDQQSQTTQLLAHLPGLLQVCDESPKPELRWWRQCMYRLHETKGANRLISSICCLDRTDENDIIKWPLVAQQWYLGYLQINTALHQLVTEHSLSQGSMVTPIKGRKVI